MQNDGDGSESVDQFLARIASVREARGEAGEQKTQDDFIKNRQERQARRLERARSLSPSKTGPARTLSNAQSNSFISKHLIDPPVALSPRKATLESAGINGNGEKTTPELQRAGTVSSRPLPVAPATKPADLSRQTPAASGLARSGTLSWQQRPRSKDGPRARPVSMFAGSDGSAPQPESAREDAPMEPSRTDITASLASKDPAFFRQTQDRGIKSAAYRKTQVEDTPQQEETSLRSMLLPGMASQRVISDTPASSPKPRALLDVLDDSHSSSKEEDRFRRGTTPDIISMRKSMQAPPPSIKPADLTPKRTTPPRDTQEQSPMSSPSPPFRTSSILNRTPSPTKGLGGFVESAMMRRSDSVNKRWSVKPDSGLKRGDSVVGARPSSAVHMRGNSRDVASSRGATPSSPLVSSRPQSSHARDADGQADTAQTDAIKQSVRTDGRPQSSTAREPPKRPITPVEDSTLARSPSKTMDPRRWSPTKSSWLESALSSTPEPPKLQPLLEEEPKWKSDLRRSKSVVGRNAAVDKPLVDAKTLVGLDVDGVPTTKSAADIRDSLVMSTEDSFRQSSEPVESKSIKVEGESRERLAAPAHHINAPPADDSTKPSAEHPILIKSLNTTKNAPVLKPKPQTPPKTDFRNTLKTRQQNQSSGTSEEPEFKSMFGKLKRTTTENYIAPDILKNNITQGKASLNVTDGPQKRKHVDEFKESILAKKEAMKGGTGMVADRGQVKDKVEEEIPEALARKQTMRSTTINKPNLPSKQAQSESAVPEALARRKTLSKANAPDLASIVSTKPSVKPVNLKPATVPKVVDEVEISAPSRLVPKSDDSIQQSATETVTPSAAALGKKVPSSLISVVHPQAKIVESQPKDSPAPMQTGPEISATPQPIFAGPVKASLNSKLASRLNPNLSNFLARGPTPSTTPRLDQEEERSGTQASPTTGRETSLNKEPQELTHMTKGRAKGPKRRGKQTETTGHNEKLSAEDDPKVVTEQDISRTIKTDVTEKSTPILPPKPESTASPPQPSSTASKIQELPIRSVQRVLPEKKAISKPQAEGDLDILTKPGPAIATKSPDPRNASNPIKSADTQSPGNTENTLQPRRLPPKPISEKPTISQTPKPDNFTVEPLTINKKPSIRSESSTKSASESLTGLGISSGPPKKPFKPVQAPRSLTPPPEKDLDIGRLHTKEEIRTTLEHYVGTLPHEINKPAHDSRPFLEATVEPLVKIETLKYTIHQVDNGGKKKPMPAQQEHILYEDSMYLLAHTYKTDTELTKVQLWCGDNVSSAALEDAQVFCRKDAREHNTKLEVIKQGKEGDDFIQALGGILITRRSKSQTQFMLCGRRHLNHIVFDEVDLSATNLCSAYTYLISSSSGKVYLWKGRSASVDVIGSARLITMDLDLTADIEEVVEGAESKQFHAVFSDTRPDSPHKRASTNNDTTTRLYRIEHEKPRILGTLNLWGLARSASPSKSSTKITTENVTPFTESDLEGPGIHILDCPQGLYIILNEYSAGKSAELGSAIHLAQEFAALSPNISGLGRKTIPKCYVVVGEPPTETRLCFRKWTRKGAPPMVKPVCVGVEQVLEALEQ